MIKILSSAISQIGEKNKKILSLTLVCHFAFSCNARINEYDYVYYSNKYCNCLEQNYSRKGEINAHLYCDSLMALENKFYRINKLSRENDTFYRIIPKGLSDSTNIFMAGFVNLIYKNCQKYIDVEKEH